MPAPFKQYKNPPVKEAIVSLSFREALSFSAIEALCPQNIFAGSYHMEHQMLSAQIGPLEVTGEGAQPAAPFKSSKDGYIMRSEAGEVLELYTTYLSLHLFRPYKGWDYLQAAFCGIWQHLQQSIPAFSVSEISARYINELKIPADGARKLHQYIHVLPVQPADVEGSIGQFFIQLQLKDKSGELRGIFTETLSPGDAPAGFSVILDITASCDQPAMLQPADCIGLLRRIRAYKNELFAGAITEAMAQSFDQL